MSQLGQTTAGHRTLDVRALPAYALGARSALWWGVILAIAIEGTMFVLLGASYFYLGDRQDVWPPEGPSRESLIIATCGTAALLLSVPPTLLLMRAARRGDLRSMRGWLLAATLFGLAAGILRAFEFDHLNFRWDSHVYGSVFWTSLGLHTVELVAGEIENLMLLVLFFAGRVEKKHLTDAEAGGLFWLFAVFVWLPFYVILYLGPVLLPR